MDASNFQRIILLNRILSKSITTAPQIHCAPIHGFEELLAIIQHRFNRGFAIEFIGGGTDDPNDEVRIRINQEQNFIRIKNISVEKTELFGYATFLIETVDHNVRSFPVVHTKTFIGRELSGDEAERGAHAAHFVVRFPNGDSYDEAEYRCVLEHVSAVSRSDIETLFNRQLRRASNQAEFEFSVDMIGKRGKMQTKIYKYHPKIELVSDVGQLFANSIKNRTLSQIVFTNRKKRLSIGNKTSIDDQDLIGDLEVRVNGRQAPDSYTEQRSWIKRLVDHFAAEGYSSKIYYKSLNGSVVSGDFSHSIGGAADLILCQREVLKLDEAPGNWRPDIDPEIVAKLKNLLDKDDIWERAESG